MSEVEPANDAASLADALLRAESERAADDAANAAADHNGPMPGVGAQEISLRQGIAAGGSFTFIVLLLLSSFDELEAAALSVLGPDIRDSFHVGNGVIVFLSSAAASFMILGALPMGWLSDRARRSRIVGISGLVFATMVTLSGFAINAFSLFCTRFGVGIGKSSTITTHGTLLADTYPIGIRGRMTATTLGASATIGALSPALVRRLTRSRSSPWRPGACRQPVPGRWRGRTRL